MQQQGFASTSEAMPAYALRRHGGTAGVSGVVCCRPGTLKSASEPLFSPEVEAIPDDMSELIVLSWQTLPPWDWPVCPVARVESRSILSILSELTKI